ncbi:D-alanyl-D-alanine carboxypeptidase, partial [Streptococcus pneumoniae]
MKKIFLTLLTISLLGGASTAVAQVFT